MEKWKCGYGESPCLTCKVAILSGLREMKVVLKAERKSVDVSATYTNTQQTIKSSLCLREKFHELFETFWYEKLTVVFLNHLLSFTDKSVKCIHFLSTAEIKSCHKSAQCRRGTHLRFPSSSAGGSNAPLNAGYRFLPLLAFAPLAAVVCEQLIAAWSMCWMSVSWPSPPLSEPLPSHVFDTQVREAPAEANIQMLMSPSVRSPNQPACYILTYLRAKFSGRAPTQRVLQ